MTLAGQIVVGKKKICFALKRKIQNRAGAAAGQGVLGQQQWNPDWEQTKYCFFQDVTPLFQDRDECSEGNSPLKNWRIEDELTGCGSTLPALTRKLFLERKGWWLKLFIKKRRVQARASRPGSEQVAIRSTRSEIWGRTKLRYWYNYICSKKMP